MRFLSYANDETDGRTERRRERQTEGLTNRARESARDEGASDRVRRSPPIMDEEELQNSIEKRPRKGRKERRNEGGCAELGEREGEVGWDGWVHGWRYGEGADYVETDFEASNSNMVLLARYSRTSLQ